MKQSENDQHGFLSVMQNQLERVISEMQGFKHEDFVHLSLIKDIINFKLKEEEVKRQFQELSNVMLEMAKLNFSSRLSIENSKDLFSYIGCSLNLVNEELEDKAMPKAFFEQVLERVLEHKPSYAILTNLEGKICYVNNGLENLIGLSKDNMVNNPIHNIFATNVHFNVTGNGTFFDKKVNLISKDSELVPVELSVIEIHDVHLESHYLYMIK